MRISLFAQGNGGKTLSLPAYITCLSLKQAQAAGFAMAVAAGQGYVCSEHIALAGNHRTSVTRKQGSCQLTAQGYPWHVI